jgi:hypothetical protein
MPTGVGARNYWGHGPGLLQRPIELGSTGAMVSTEVPEAQTSEGSTRCELIAPVSAPVAEPEAPIETVSRPGG